MCPNVFDILNVLIFLKNMLKIIDNSRSSSFKTVLLKGGLLLAVFQILFFALLC